MCQSHDFSADFLYVSSISNVYFGSTPWFFFHFLNDFIHTQIFTWCQTHDFSSCSLYISYFFYFFFTLVQTHDFFAHFFYIMNFKSLPWPNPMIFFLFLYNSRQIKAFTLCQAHDFFILFLCKSVQIHDFSSISTDKSTNHITFWQRTIIFLLFL